MVLTSGLELTSMGGSITLKQVKRASIIIIVARHMAPEEVEQCGKEYIAMVRHEQRCPRINIIVAMGELATAVPTSSCMFC